MSTAHEGDRSQAAPASPEQTYSIRDLCQMFDVTPRALRFYESQGLLSPRRDGQKRIYNSRDRARLKLVLRGKRFGFTLAETREHLDLYDLGDGQVTQLRRALDTAVEKLAELEDKRRDIDEAIDELKAQMAMAQRMLDDRIAAGEDDSDQADADSAGAQANAVEAAPRRTAAAR